jgi:hypothetical protein
MFTKAHASCATCVASCTGLDKQFHLGLALNGLCTSWLCLWEVTRQGKARQGNTQFSQRQGNALRTPAEAISSSAQCHTPPADAFELWVEMSHYVHREMAGHEPAEFQTPVTSRCAAVIMLQYQHAEQPSHNNAALSATTSK